MASALAPAPAAAAPFSTTASTDASALLSLLLGGVSGLSNFNASISGDPAAIGFFSDFFISAEGLAAAPFAGNTFAPVNIAQGVVLSAGRVDRLPGVNNEVLPPNAATGASTDFGAPGADGDRAELLIAFDAAASGGTLALRAAFASEEFGYGLTGGFFQDDRVSVQLNGVEIGLSSLGNPLTIVNLLANSSSEIAPNGSIVTSSTTTQLDGSTPLTEFAGSLVAGANTLRISIEDGGDGIIDSALFLAAGSLMTVEPPPPPPPPPPPFTASATTDEATLLAALFGDASGLSDFQVTLDGDPEAFGVFADGPFRIPAGVVLSSGRVDDLEGENTFASEGTDFGAPGVDGDRAEMTVRFLADGGVNALRLAFGFGSEEYRHPASPAADIFEIYLNGVRVSLDRTGNPGLFVGSDFDLIMNGVGFGTEITLDGYMDGALGFVADLLPGQYNELRIVVADLIDGEFDTAGFLRVSAIPESGGHASIALGLLCLALRRARARRG